MRLQRLALQYAMLLDVVNNVVLHVEPERRRTLERRARMRFQLQLHRDTDPRHLIHKLQTQVTIVYLPSSCRPIQSNIPQLGCELFLQVENG